MQATECRQAAPNTKPVWEDTCGMNVRTLKIVGRAAKQGEIAKSISIVKTNIAIAEQSSSRKEYLENMIFPSDTKTCLMGLSCYYPEIRFGIKGQMLDRCKN